MIGQIQKLNAHPQADKLRVALVDIGEKKPLSIVCGGANLEEGQWVAVAKLGAKVKWHGEGELIELKPVEIRGVSSEGMICAASEIGLFDAFPHVDREIMNLNWLQQAGKKTVVKAGTPLASALGLTGDVVMDIEVTTNRPDAVGMVGLAREAAAILQRPFVWKPTALPKATKTKTVPLRVRVSEKKLCPRYMAVRMDQVEVGPSPWWLKRRLLSAGLRPVNNIVDITNYVMLELGQPMHAFDAEKLTNESIEVRQAAAGETMAALDGKTYQLEPGMLVIADAEKPVAVAGVMGGEGTSVTRGTRSIVFEAATFDPVSVRRTARKLNLYSDAQLRYEKGLSTQALPEALARAIELCEEIASGQLASSIVDQQANAYKVLTYKISLEELTKLIGVPLPRQEVVSTLTRLGFKVTMNGKMLSAVVPWWRDHDIESGRDLVEEVARIYGYTNIPAIFPLGMTPKRMDQELVHEQRVRTLSKGAGLTETYTYSFVSRELLEKAGYNPEHMLRVQNPLSSDFEFMRTTLLPSLLQVVAENQERFDHQRLFEVAHVYYPKKADWSELPDEQLELGGAFFGEGQIWKEAKGYVEQLLSEFGITDLQWKSLTHDAFWHSGRSVQVYTGDRLLGTVGEVHPRVARAFKIEKRVALVDLPLETLFALAKTGKQATPLPIFPEIKRDLAVIVDRDTEVQTVIATVLTEANQPLLKGMEWFDTYRGESLATDKKSLAFHVTFGHPERTLETKEVDEAMEAIVSLLKKRCGAEIRT